MAIFTSQTIMKLQRKIGKLAVDDELTIGLGVSGTSITGAEYANRLVIDALLHAKHDWENRAREVEEEITINSFLESTRDTHLSLNDKIINQVFDHPLTQSDPPPAEDFKKETAGTILESILPYDEELQSRAEQHWKSIAHTKRHEFIYEFVFKTLDEWIRSQVK